MTHLTPSRGDICCNFTELKRSLIMNYVKSCLIITMLLGIGYSQCNEPNWQDYYPNMAGCQLSGADLIRATFLMQSLLGHTLIMQPFLGQVYVILLALQMEIYVKNLGISRMRTKMDMMTRHMMQEQKVVT